MKLRLILLRLRMSQRWERLMRKWRLDNCGTYVRVYDLDFNGIRCYYNIFAKTRWEAIKKILCFIWHGPTILVKGD